MTEKTNPEGEEEVFCGGSSELRLGGGSVWLRLPNVSRREVRERIKGLAGRNGQVVYDTDSASSKDLPKTPEEVKQMLTSVGPREVLVLLGSNPFSMENEIAAMVVRGESDWSYARSNLFPKVLVRTEVNNVKWMLNRSDLKQTD